MDLKLYYAATTCALARCGPVLVGGQFLGGVGKVKYEFGYLFGLTNGSPAGILRWRLELEIPL